MTETTAASLGAGAKRPGELGEKRRQATVTAGLKVLDVDARPMSDADAVVAIRAR